MNVHQNPVTVVVESTLVDICDLLGAQRFELDGARVVFVKHDDSGEITHWRGHLGDQLTSCENGWRIGCERSVETIWATVA